MSKQWVVVEVEIESEITTNQRKVEESDQNLEVDLDHEAEVRKEIEIGIHVEIEERGIGEEGIKKEKLEEGIERGLRPLQKMMLEPDPQDPSHRIRVAQQNEKIPGLVLPKTHLA